MERPAPVSVLKKRSRRAFCFGSGMLTIRFARWKASEIPNPRGMLAIACFCGRGGEMNGGRRGGGREGVTREGYEGETNHP